MKTRQGTGRDGAHILCHQGHGRAVPAVRGVRRWSRALRERSDVPIHFHTHDTSGINAASILRASDAGVDIADGGVWPACRALTSQPNLNSIVAALGQHRRATPGLNLDRAESSSATTGKPSASCTTRSKTGMKPARPRCTQHEMPGGQYTNLRQQAKSLHLEERWHEVADAYTQVNANSSATS